MNWTSERIRALRLALRLTQEEFADLLRAAPKTVRNWELDRHPPGLALQRALDNALGAASQEQRRRFDAAQPSGKEEATDRRQALRTLGTVTGAMLASSSLDSIELARQAEASDLGPTTLEQLDRAVRQFGLDYLQAPLPDMFTAVQQARHYVAQLLAGRHTLAQQRHLYVVAGWLSALLAHLSLDLGHPSAVHTHSVTALRLAAEVGEEELTAWVRGTQVMLATYAGRPDEAVLLAREGLRAAPEGSATTVRLHAQEARAYARAHDLHLAEKAMGAAEAAFGRLHARPSSSIFSFQVPYLSFYAGTSYVWLGQSRRAESRSTEAIALCDASATEWPVARVLARVDLATALLQRGEAEQAARLGAEAVTLAADRRTEPVRQRVVELHGGLLAHRTLSAVRDFGEQVRTTWT